MAALARLWPCLPLHRRWPVHPPLTSLPGSTIQTSAPLLWVGQQLFNPLQRVLADGCHLTRDPLPAIEAAGFSSVDARRLAVEGMGLIAPHVAGIATL